jgi:hypothetical protein
LDADGLADVDVPGVSPVSDAGSVARRDGSFRDGRSGSMMGIKRLVLDAVPAAWRLSRVDAMKNAVVVLLALGSSLATAAPFIAIGDEKLTLAFAPAESPVRLREYVSTGETVDHWTQLASVRTFANLLDPRAFLEGVSKTVLGSNPDARAQLLQNADKSLLVLDFLTYPPASTRPFFAEWNLMRAAYVEGRGLVVYQYARRFYSPTKETAVTLNSEREKMLTPFAVASFQESDDPR